MIPHDIYNFEDLPIITEQYETKDGWHKYVPKDSTISELLEVWDIDDPDEMDEMVQVLRYLKLYFNYYIINKFKHG